MKVNAQILALSDFGLTLFSIASLATMAAKLALVEIKICVPAAKTANFFLTMSAIYPATALMAITKMLLQINAHHVTRNAKHVMESPILTAFLAVSPGIWKIANVWQDVL